MSFHRYPNDRRFCHAVTVTRKPVVVVSAPSLTVTNTSKIVPMLSPATLIVSWLPTTFTLAAGSHEIRTSHPDYETDAAVVMLKQGVTNQHIYLKRTGAPPEPLVTLTAQIGGPDPQGGNQVVLLKGARVRVTQGGRQIVSGSTDGNGLFTARLKPGHYEINAAHSSYLPGKETVILSGANVHHRMLLKPAITGHPITAVTVRVQVGGVAASGGTQVVLLQGARVTIAHNGRVTATGATDQNGLFSAQLVPGTYQIQVTHGSYYPSSTNVTLIKETVSRRILLNPKKQIR